MHKSYITALILLGCSALTAHAQQQETPSKDLLAKQLEVRSNYWNSSTNAAGLLLDKPSESAILEAGYKQDEGDFRRPQGSLKDQTLFLNTEGNSYLKKYYVQGNFSYKRVNKSEANYNAGLIDPFRNMPYSLADTNSSDWFNQHYNLGFKITTPKLADKWSLGLAVDYEASSGAKQRDIRTLNKYYALSLSPAVVYSVNEENHIGFNALYKSYKEESNNQNLNNYVNQTYYFLSGLGNAIEYVGIGRNMDYQGEALGGGLQFQHQGELMIFASANYTLQAEDANIGFTNTRPGGSILAKIWDFNLNLEKETTNFKNRLQLNYKNSKSEGTEYVTEFVSGLESTGYYTRFESIRSKYNNQQASASYQLIRKRADAYNWYVGAHLAYDKLDNSYLIPAALMRVENVTYGLSVNKAFDLNANKHAKLAIGLDLTLKNNMASTYTYTGKNSEDVTVRKLEEGNLAYFTADYTSLALPIVYTHRLQESNTSLFVKATGQIQKSNNEILNKRKGFLLSIGATF